MTPSPYEPYSLHAQSPLAIGCHRCLLSDPRPCCSLLRPRPLLPLHSASRLRPPAAPPLPPHTAQSSVACCLGPAAIARCCASDRRRHLLCPLVIYYSALNLPLLRPRP
ncbi:hypothetical protein PR202_ga03547 [Eleusine coracana subsp. coracana]|uniref:Uncharacterized protein n=1 Tax=Eleusine coracana subsp. coracana TaxID=191504 RepID=A0AAV5BP91_ELECO|nr:hypothetical protein PR202_ga03547 [Eleusine coracana subsp. coracana]